MTSFFDIILLLFVVIFVFGKLRSVLGTRPDGQNVPVKVDDTKTEEFLTLLKGVKKVKSADVLSAEVSEEKMALQSIKGFEEASFIAAAKRVFEIVLESYANDKTENLKPLVNKPLFEKFEKAIKDKQDKKETSFAELISFKNVEILDVKILKTVAKIVVGFETEQMNITKDEKGNVINGDEQFLQTINDSWTFEKQLNSNSPVWLLASTKR